MAPALTPQQVAQAVLLRDRLLVEMNNRPDASQSATLPDGSLSPDGELDAPRGTTRPRSDTDDSDELPASLLDDPNAPYTLEQGREFKRHKNLSGQADHEADIFLRTTNPMRHLFQLVVVSLQCRDMLQVIKTDQDRKYKLPDTLTKTCQDYAHAGLLSPKAKNYRNSKDDPKIARNIVSAMRMLNVEDLPPSLETGRCEVLMKVINRALIAKRYHIKAQIVTSLISTTRVDIAALTRACIGNSPTKPTAALYQRIAFIRSIAVDHKAKMGAKALAPDGAEAKDDSKDGFWVAVDDELAVYHTLSASERQVMFDAIYREDVKIHGPPDNTIPLTLMQDVEAWLTTLNMAMEK